MCEIDLSRLASLIQVDWVAATPDEKLLYERHLTVLNDINIGLSGMPLFYFSLVHGDIDDFRKLCKWIGQPYDVNPPLNETVDLYEQHKSKFK